MVVLSNSVRWWRGYAGLLLLVALVGHVVDKTTGQPLTGVDVQAQGPAKSHPGRTNDAGTFTIHGLTPGRYRLTLSSDDVPPQTFELVIHTAKLQHIDLTACSTTLDYSCANGLP